MASEPELSQLAPKIDTAQARIVVIGLGYVGCPLAAAFAEAGFRVVGLDVDADRVATVNAGQSPVQDLPSATVACLVRQGGLRATTEPDVLSEADAIVICVPTPCDKTRRPILTHIVNAGLQMSERLRPGQLIVLESTTYPGTTEEVLLPILERSGCRCGIDFELAYSPERVDPGNRQFTLRNTPKIVAGVTPRSGELAGRLYRHVVDRIVPVSGPRVAEMAKLLENTFRHVNIALANEMALLCHEIGINVWDVIDAAATKPFGFMPFQPGPGVGGHCIPVDPFYLSWKAREYERPARLIELAGDINDQMPDVVVERVTEALNRQGKSLRDSHILLLGISYKRDIGDIRESPALKVMERLRRRGAGLSYHDPYVPSCLIGSRPVDSVALDEETLAGADCVVILTDHRCFPYDQIVRAARALVDTRNALQGHDEPGLIRL
jgi:UDP-N-acetyl-D-glucosamine dehydrogenase